MTTAPTPALRALAEAAEGNGEHIYTHPRDSNKWRENEAWHRAASPGAVLHLLDRIHELEMQALDLASENSILKRRDADELEARKPLPPARVDELMAEAGYLGAPAESRADFINGLRHGEGAHGITGGSS